VSQNKKRQFVLLTTLLVMSIRKVYKKMYK
jgi:hypothetical protein